MWACISLRIASINKAPLTRLWLRSTGDRAHRERTPMTTCPLASPRRDSAATPLFRPCFCPPLWHRQAHEFVPTEHSSPPCSCSYQSSTLTPFLGQLERIGAHEVLVPNVGTGQAGHLIYMNGHMMAYWSRVAMHRARSPWRGRIMAGSQAVIAHRSGQGCLCRVSSPR